MSLEDAMEKEMLDAITALYGTPKGKFFRGTHGVTHVSFETGEEGFVFV